MVKVLVLFLFCVFALSTVSAVDVSQQTVLSSMLVSASSPLEQQVLSLVNNYRASGATCGGVVKPPVPILTWNVTLANAARGHSRDMTDKNYFSHASLDGRTFITRIINAGYYPYTALGENIAAGYSTANSVMQGWMTSPGHCNNIMSSSFKELGVGYAYNSLSTYDHYWTQDFGRRS